MTLLNEADAVYLNSTPVDRIYAGAVQIWPETAFTPLKLFRSGEIGAWFDPSDPSALSQDNAGATPVTSPGDVVGLAMDRSANGLDATQATLASRPVWALWPRTGRRNLLGNNISGSGGTLQNVTAAVITADPTFADVIEITATATDGYHNISFGILADDQLYSRSVRVKKPTGGARYVTIGEATSPTSASNTSIFDLDTGEFTHEGSSQDVFAAAALGDGWYEIGFVRTGVNNNTRHLHIGMSQAAAGAGSFHQFAGAGEKLWLAYPQIELGTDKTAYQRVAAAYDVTEPGVPHVRFLQDDGVDDSLIVTLPFDDYTRAYVDASGNVTYEDEVTIGGAENILRAPQLAGVLYINRTLLENEKAQLTGWWQQ